MTLQAFLRGAFLGSVGLACLLGCSGLFEPSAPITLSDRWDVTAQADEWVIASADGAELWLSDWEDLRSELVTQGCRRLALDHFAESLSRQQLGYFECRAQTIEVLGGDDGVPAARLRLASPTPVTLSAEPVWSDVDVVEPADMAAVSGHCASFGEYALFPGGKLPDPDYSPFQLREVGSWELSDGNLTVHSIRVEPGHPIEDAQSMGELECLAVRLWDKEGQKGWLCEDRFEPCVEPAAQAWIHVVGPVTPRELVGRVFGADSALSSQIPVVPDDATAGAALTVAYRPDHADLAGYVAALLERDLGVRPTLHERPEAGAPIVVGVPTNLGSDVP
ncbi:MAG: hypothetical protein ACJATT_003683 [Myxococcota bacterium]